MQNFKYQQSSSAATIYNNHDVICGLEGYLLPRYLALRSGYHCNIQSNNNCDEHSALNVLLKAQNEVAQPRHKCQVGAHNVSQLGAHDAPKASRPKKRKRKRKFDHLTDAADDDIVESNSVAKDECSVSNDDMQTNHTTTTSVHAPKRKRRSRKRKQKVNNQGNDNALTDADNKAAPSNNGDWTNHQIIGRIIIAPFTASLIATVEKCKKLMEKKEKEDCNHQSIKSGDERKDGKKDNVPSDAQSDASGSSSTAVPPNHNVYQKQKASNNTQTKSSSSSSSSNNNFLLSLSTPKESLESIVDGAVCTLVRRTHRYRSRTAFKGRGNSSSGGKIGKQNVIYRRRPRGKSKQGPLADATTRTTALRIDNRTTTAAVNNTSNNWLLEQNLLSKGYTLGSGDTLTSSSSSSSHANNNQQQLLRGCPNMAPGIHCLHPNTLTSYSRSSSLMKCLHSIIGDDALREMLVNAIILVPAISTTKGKAGDSVVDTETIFDRGNYFQLCGPPINKLAKTFDDMSSTLAATAATNDRKRKRNGMDENEESVATNNTDGKNKEESTQKNKRQWDPNKPIPRGNLFYCDFYNRHAGLSPNHLLNQSDDDNNNSSADDVVGSKPKVSVNVKLLNSMVRIWPVHKQQRSNNKSSMMTTKQVVVIKGCNKRRSRWRRLRESGIAMCQETRRRHRNCDYTRLLEYHCPLPADTLSAITDSKTTLAHNVTLYTPVNNVGSFLEAVLRSAFPNSFWGSVHNFEQVVRTVRVFTKLGRTEQLPEKAIVDGIRVLDMKWLLPNNSYDNHEKRRKLSRSDHESTTDLVRNVMRWLYRQFIIPLLRSTFYITETEFTGSRVLYYRRPVWSRIKSLSMGILLKQQYREMTAAKAKKLLLNHNVGCPPAPLRILPKKTGIRAIAMLSKSCDTDIMAAIMKASTQQLAAPPNKILQPIFHALKYEHEKKPSLFGAGVLGLTEVFPSFCAFLDALKQRQSSASSMDNDGRQNSLYFTSVDIKHCYDTINQKHLLKLIKSVIQEDVYLTKSNFILHSRDNNNSLRCQWKKSTFQSSQFLAASTNTLVEKCFHSILVDGVHCSMEKKERITGLLRDHIFGQVVVANGSHGPRYLLQKNGIPQVGAVVYILVLHVTITYNHHTYLTLVSTLATIGKCPIIHVL